MQSRTPPQGLSLIVTALALSGCSDATGTLQGGEQLTLPQVTATEDSSTSPAEGGTTASATWTDLYMAYFGNAATGACGAVSGACHQAATDSGFTLAPTPGSHASGFVCGTTAASCYQGMLHATPALIGTEYMADPTKAPLYLALFQGGTAGMTSDNMPLTQTFIFAPSDLALIAQWIQDGAPNN